MPVLYYAVYGWCRFATKCSFLPYSLSNSKKRDNNGIDEMQEIQQTLAELREEVRTLRLEVDRLGNENRHLLEVVEVLEKDVTRHEDRQEVEDSVDGQEVEDWCALLDYPTRNETECAEMITGLKQIAGFLVGENSDDVYTRIERCGGLSKIQQLRSHAHEHIRHRAKAIFEILTSRKTRSSREGGAMERDVAMNKKDQRASNPVSRRGGRGQHDRRKKQ